MMQKINFKIQLKYDSITFASALKSSSKKIQKQINNQQQGSSSSIPSIEITKEHAVIEEGCYVNDNGEYLQNEANARRRKSAPPPSSHSQHQSPHHQYHPHHQVRWNNKQNTVLARSCLMFTSPPLVVCCHCKKNYANINNKFLHNLWNVC